MPCRETSVKVNCNAKFPTFTKQSSQIKANLALPLCTECTTQPQQTSDPKLRSHCGQAGTLSKGFHCHRTMLMLACDSSKTKLAKQTAEKGAASLFECLQVSGAQGTHLKR